MNDEKNITSGATANVDENELNNDKNDPFAYLNRHFSNEKYKLIIRNLPKYFGMGELKKVFNNKLKLNVRKIKMGNNRAKNAFICFKNEEERENAIKVLNGYNWKGNVLEVLKAKPSADPFVLKRSLENSEDSQESKRRCDDTHHLSTEERVKTSSTPLADYPYEEQLNIKQKEIHSVLEKLSKELFRLSPVLKLWITRQRAANNGFICPIDNIKYSSKTEGYRNKCDFSFGIDKNTKLPVVGFRLDSYAHGSISVGPVDHLKHVPEEMKNICKVFEKFIPQSKLEVFDAEIQCSHFRQLTVRVAKDQLMIIVGIHPQNLTEDELKEFKRNLVEYFTCGPGKDCGVTSLYYEVIVKKTSQDDQFPMEHLWGETHNYEQILGLKFKISPQAFFQVNTQAVEILYQTAIDLAEPNQNSTILDVCCGTGTIGLCFSKYCNQVLGIESVPKAIADAKENALLNNIENATFYVGTAENMIGTVCYNSKNDDIIAVLDPPRAGLHQKAILQLRKVKNIKKVIYISCKPQAALKNFTDLARPESKFMKGEPFVPTKAVPVDLFPHTKHFELIVVFERFSLVSEKVQEVNVTRESVEKIESSC